MADKPIKYKNLTEVYGDGYMLDPEYSDKPFKPDMGAGASEYVSPNPSKAGAGRGKQGGPTAGELKAKEAEDNRDALQKYRAEKKGTTVEKMRKDASDKFDQRVKAGELYKRGGKVKKMASGGMTSKTSSASKRADGCCTKGKTRGKMY